MWKDDLLREDSYQTGGLGGRQTIRVIGSLSGNEAPFDIWYCVDGGSFRTGPKVQMLRVKALSSTTSFLLFPDDNLQFTIMKWC